MDIESFKRGQCGNVKKCPTFLFDICMDSIFRIASSFCSIASCKVAQRFYDIFQLFHFHPVVTVTIYSMYSYTVLKTGEITQSVTRG